LTSGRNRAFIDVRRPSAQVITGPAPPQHPTVSTRRRITVARDERAPPVSELKADRSSGSAPRRLTVSVDIVRVRGPDAEYLAEVQLEAIKEVLRWAVQHQHHDGDRAA
jgi:hypothetical protein